ncbi:MAG TPA: bifunctional phosphoribosylaminoimidazolecarboxamide formyltransferase/IMP cyclohydrolase [Chitinophagaceae bacterium]|jgi:phosphoribosylaminoimidazolecarboxamide formyltransferase/IMP cyclohydrolase|nr:bifunctional phosphoribosylaminoimidazolecarboxamide formyltransferase/IMP cyclohydrolase [Chitinophagaceae bacterium]
MNKKIRTALISVFYKDGLEPIVKLLSELGITIYSTGGTQKFIEDLGITVIPVEKLTSYPSILGGRVKTLHPSVFGGILGRRDNDTDIKEMQQYGIPEIDLVIVDLYPFEETVAATNDEQKIIEKIDIGGPSMIRGAAKNFKDVTVIASKNNYGELKKILKDQNGETSLEQRKEFAAVAFEIVKQYDIAISDYFNSVKKDASLSIKTLRYGENPHQQASFKGNLDEIFTKLHGKEISYNNLVDIDAAIQLIREFSVEDNSLRTFAIIKHTNVCGIASRMTTAEAWKNALAGDPESAFGGVLITNSLVDKETAAAINEIFFEVLIAPVFEKDALDILQSKKNRILLQIESKSEDPISADIVMEMHRSLLNGELIQTIDEGNFLEWREEGGREANAQEKEDLIFANLVCKHLKSNAIALVKNKQLLGKGCGQTSRIDALRQAIEKAKQFNFDLHGAVMASDAFFPFNDCVKMGHEAGIIAFIQPGGSIRDKDSIDYCKQNNLAMVMTGMRHFKH